eukprot:Em0010g549a
MLSRQEKKRAKRAKRHAKYLEVRNDVLESARAFYKAEPEKKRTAKRASGIKKTQKRNGPLNAKAIKKTQKRNGPLKGNVIGRVLNLLAWRRECGTRRLSVRYPAKPTRPSKDDYR